MANYKKFIITEQDRTHILSLYGLLKEDEVQAAPQQQQSASSLKFDKTINFAPGYYRNKGPVTTKAGITYNWDVDTTLNADLAKIKEFLKNNPTGYVVEVNLYSGESNIPNNDNEKGGTAVNPGYLSTARMNSLKAYLNPIFESWKSEGITKTDFKINEIPQPGKTPWKGTPFCPADVADERTCSTTYYSKVKAGDKVALEYKAKYDAEQNFRVIIEVKKTETTQTKETTATTPTTVTTKNTEDCATGLKIRVDVEQHECNNAEFFLFLNNTLMYNVDGGYTANGNNGKTYITSDSGKKIKAKRLNPGYGKLGTRKYGATGDIGNTRYDEFIVTPEQSREIVKQSNNGKINVWYICTLASGCHLDTPTVTIFKDDAPIYKGKPMSDSSLLITLDACGNKVSDVIDEDAREPNVDVMRNKVQNDRMSMVIDNENDVPDEEDSKQKELKASNTLSTMITYINKLLINPTTKEIYYNQSNTKPKVYQSTGTWHGKPSYINFNVPQNKLLFDWTKNKLGDPALSIYLEEIKRLITQNNYQIKDGQFVDRNLRTNKLYGDVRSNLQKFYQEFNQQFDMDAYGDITLQGVDEEYPLNYVRILSKVRNPNAVYNNVPINP